MSSTVQQRQPKPTVTHMARAKARAKAGREPRSGRQEGQSKFSRARAKGQKGTSSWGRLQYHLYGGIELKITDFETIL